jgi:hypothetical protein
MHIKFKIVKNIDQFHRIWYRMHLGTNLDWYTIDNTNAQH